MEGPILSRFEPIRLDYHILSAMLQKYHKFQPKPKTHDELKVALQTIWEELPQEHINKAVANFTVHLEVRLPAWLPFRASAVTVPISKSASHISIKNQALFRATHGYRRKQRSKTLKTRN